MRIGTMWCFLWGHNFMVHQQEIDGMSLITKNVLSPFCVRCGIEREEAK